MLFIAYHRILVIHIKAVHKRVVDRVTPDAVILGEIIVISQPFQNGSLPSFAVQRMDVHVFPDRNSVEHTINLP